MSPEITTAMAMVSIVDKLGGWSIGSIFIFLATMPPLFIYLAARIIAKALNGLKKQMAINEKESEKRFLTFEAKYDNNIRFVEDYASLTDGLNETLRRNTIAMTKLVDRIETMKGMK